jgi:YidC/Oxa1 family membrane protein insertase
MMGKLDKTGKLILFGSIGLLIAGFLLQSKKAPKRQQAAADANATQLPPGVIGDGNQSDPNPFMTNAPLVPPTPGTTTPPVTPPAPALAEKTAVLANDFVEYTFTSRGGGISNVKLIERDPDKKNRLKYPKEIKDHRKGPMQLMLDRGRLPLLALEPSTGSAIEYTPNAARPYQAQPSSYSISKAGNTVTAIASFGSWLVKKEFALGEAAYLLEVTVTVSNNSASTLGEVPFYLVTGTAHEPLSTSRMMGLGYGTMWYDGVEENSVGSSWFGNYRMGCQCFGSLGERNNYRAGQGKVRWVGGFSRFFIQAVIPAEPGALVNINQFTLDALPEAEARELGVKVTNNQKAYETALLVKVPSLPPAARRFLSTRSTPARANTTGSGKSATTTAATSSIASWTSAAGSAGWPRRCCA